MVLKLLPQQISEKWELIKWAIGEALPPIAGESPEKMNRILENLLNDTMQCWVGTDKDRVVRYILTSCILEDYCTDTKSLLIYTLTGFGLTDELWIEGYKSISKYAKGKGCIRIVAYSNEPEILDRVRWLEGSTSFTFITLPLTLE